jgi:hypothetical protein
MTSNRRRAAGKARALHRPDRPELIVPRLSRTARAKKDLIEIWLSIASDNERAADALLERIDRVCGSLAACPELGPAPPTWLRYFDT